MKYKYLILLLGFYWPTDSFSFPGEKLSLEKINRKKILGNNIKSYLNGVFASREPELINNTKGFPGYPDGLVQSKNPYYFPNGIGDNGYDFTVGAVMLKKGMGNFFKGLIGGIAIYNRALTDEDLLGIGSL